MWNQGDSSSNVFIKNLKKSIGKNTIFDIFSGFGIILSLKIAVDEEGTSKGYGFIQFDTEKAANMSIEKVNGMLLQGKKVYVGKFIPRQERQKVKAYVYVKNFGEDMDDDKLRDMFEPFGKITSHKILVKDDGETKRGFAFVSYECNDAAESACIALNGKEISDGKIMYVGRSQMKGEPRKSYNNNFELENRQGLNLYVSNLDETLDKEDLRKHFSHFGTIASTKVIVDREGCSKGYGFVCFKSAKEASRAVDDLNGTTLGSRKMNVAFAKGKVRPDSLQSGALSGTGEGRQRAGYVILPVCNQGIQFRRPLRMPKSRNQ